jgi:dehydrogenase/reductase SDR family protein 12
MLSSVLDAVLDRTVVVGYTSVGYRLRQHWWNPGDLRPMNGEVVLVTGATSGLGLAAAEGFARLGACVWLLARDPQRGEQARASVAKRSGAAEVHVGLCDLSDLGSVREFAASFRAQTPRLDVLVNNAGVLANERRLSADGIELTFATNVVGPFLLTNLLIPLLEQSAPSRIVNVSSGGMYTQRIRVDDLQMDSANYDGTTAYARAKRAQVILTELWAERLQGSGVVVHAMHPGWADTPGVRASLPRFYTVTKPFLRTPEQGADTILWLGAAPKPAQSSGKFWHDRVARPTHLLPRTRETTADRERLWAECERLSGCGRSASA